MIYGSVCSGIEAASVAWHPLGWKASFLSEIEKFPRDVLAHHYPETPLHGDFTTIKKDDYEPINLLVGGTPCQSFSVAGLRAGLNDPRGNLMLEFGALANRLQPKWLVWENVPGVLSSNDGKDFGSFLAMLAELGYGFAYRVLDAQHFGVPQRRRRVFVIGCLGDWRSAAAVLFERDSLQGNPPPSRSTGQEVAGTLTRGFGDRGLDLDQIAGGGYALQTFDRQSSGEYGDAPVASTMSARDYKSPSDLVTYGIPGNWIGRKPENGGNAVEPMHDVSPCLTKADQHAVAIPINTMTMMGRPSDDINPRMGSGIGKDGEPCPTLTKAHSHAVATFKETADCLTAAYGTKWNGNASADNGSLFAKQGMQVRRLMPIECERLQGFPDNYTNIPGASDSPRYKALGNSMAVPVMRWIGERIQKVEAMQ
jgi:DNA (cytosine-5)-methyltransferase 1